MLMDEQLWLLPVPQKAHLALQRKTILDVDPGTDHRPILPWSQWGLTQVRDVVIWSCESCHNRPKQSKESSGFVSGALTSPVKV